MTGLEAYGRIEGREAYDREVRTMQRRQEARARKQPRRRRPLHAAVRLLRRSVPQGT